MSSTPAAEPVVLSWSGGKDCALALMRLRQDPAYDVVGLLTTVTAGHDRISIHGVRRALLHAQAAAVGLPLQEVTLAPGCSNGEYEEAMTAALGALRTARPDVARIAFGDIFLEDVRRYREASVAASSFGAVFPLWGAPTAALADELFANGFIARLVCVDTHALDAAFAGRLYDAELLSELPATVDVCGENGEFHTFVSDGPVFDAPVPHAVGDVVLRDDRFAFCDLAPVSADA